MNCKASNAWPVVVAREVQEIACMVTTDDGHQTFQYNHTSSSRTSLGDDGGTYGYHPLIGEASVHTAFSSSSAGAGGAPPAECGRALFLLVVSLGRSWGGGSTPRRLAASCGGRAGRYSPAVPTLPCWAAARPLRGGDMPAGPEGGSPWCWRNSGIKGRQCHLWFVGGDH